MEQDYVLTIKNNILEQFQLMEEKLKVDFDSVSNNLRKKFIEQIDKIEQLVKNKEINPSVKININRDDNTMSQNENIKIGVYPVAGNPMHWAHLMNGLDCLVQQKVDKIIFIVQGEDLRKPDLLNTKERYPMNKEILKLFSPLFEFSNIAELKDETFGVSLIGEYNIFKILKLNPQVNIEACYMVGSDHLHRFVEKNGKMQKDTIGHLEDNIKNKIFDFNSEQHSIKAFFIARDKNEFDKNLQKIKFPQIEILQIIPSFSFSSTEIRNALTGKGNKNALAFLPYITYQRIINKKLYNYKNVL